MEILMRNERFGKIIALSVFLLITLLIVSLIRLIIGSYIIAFIIYIGIIWYLLRALGSYIMYPGSSFYTRSDIQQRFSKEIGARIIVFFNAVHFLSKCVAKRRYHSYENNWDLVVNISRHIKMFIQMLGMFQSSLSQRKTHILHIYRELDALMDQRPEDNRWSLNDFINKPKLIDQIHEEYLPFYKEKFQRIGALALELIQIVKSYTPPTGTFDNLKFRMTEENLYEIRYGFYNWKNLFKYQIFTVSTEDGALLETAIIHSESKESLYRYEEKKQGKSTEDTNKCVLFCNPNGVFIQFFGADNEYMKNYLRLGYKVILWNYRGYGQSTGNPTISLSQSDALTVYKEYRKKGYDIKIVHGYSIGGAAAVGLLDKLAKSPENQHQIQNIDILIVDRSFSSIGQMSIQFGPALHNLTKVIFFADNIDISHQFEQAKCKKLLIWDFSDEVIPDRASVKNRIIKRKKGSSAKSNNGCDEENQVGQLNEDVSYISYEQINSNADFEGLTRKLVFTIRSILQFKAQSAFSDHQMDVMKDQQRDISGRTSVGDTETNVPFLIKLIDEIDGGGINIFRNKDQLFKILNQKQQYFNHIMESYVLGIVCYGSYYPLRPILHHHKKIKEETLRKLERSMKILEHKYAINTGQAQILFKEVATYDQLVKNLYHIYFKLAQLVNDYYSEEWFNRHGSLLPTNNGHNCSLNDQEISTLNEFIENASGNSVALKEEQSGQSIL